MRARSSDRRLERKMKTLGDRAHHWLGPASRHYAGIVKGAMGKNYQQTFSGEIMDSVPAKDRSHEKMMGEMKSLGRDKNTCARKSVPRLDPPVHAAVKLTLPKSLSILKSW